MGRLARGVLVFGVGAALLLAPLVARPEVNASVLTLYDDLPLEP